MATLWTGSVTTKAQDNWVNAYVFDAEIIENSTSVENNTSNVTLNLYAKGINGYTYSATGPTAYIDLNGTRKTTPAVSSIGSSRTLIASYTENIEHKDDGTKSISVTFGYSPNSSANYLPKAVSLQANNIALSTIPRKANITSFTVVPKSETSLTFSFTASAICDYAWYSTDNGTNWTGLDITDGTSATFDVTGLSVATSYNCKIKVRRKDSQLTSDPTDAVQKSTYDYPKVTNVGTANLTIGNEQTLTLYNPLGRNVTIRMNKTNASGTQLYSGTTSTAGQSVTFKFTPTASTLYNSIPNDASASCVYSVIYSNISTKTTTGNYTYKIIGTETPTFSDTNWSYSTNLTALTNNHTEVAIDNKSTITVTINTSATSSYGANIDKYVVKWGTGTTTDINAGSTSGSVSTGSGNTLTVIVYDKRGLLKETTKTITNVPYANVIINNDINTQRTNGVEAGTKLNLSGTFYNAKFGTNGVQNALYSAKYYTSTNGTTWSNAYPSDNTMLNAITVSGNNFTLSNFDIHANGTSGGFTVGTRYYIKVEIKDAQGLLGTTVVTTTVTDGKIARDVYQDSNGDYHTGINGLADSSYTEKINGTLATTDDISIAKNGGTVKINGHGVLKHWSTGSALAGANGDISFRPKGTDDTTNQMVLNADGTLNLNKGAIGNLVIKRTDNAYASTIRFDNTNGMLGAIGMTGNANGRLQRWNKDYATGYEVVDRSIQTNNTSKTYIATGTNFPTINSIAYWNGAYNSSNNSNLTYAHQGTIQCKPTSLYSNASGTTGSVTLSETCANFSCIDIIFARPGGNKQSVRLYNPNGDKCTLIGFSWANGQTRTWWNMKSVSFSAKTVSFVSDTGGVGWVGGGNTTGSGAENNVTIYAVMGWK